jgi:hypothetical protein
MLAITITHRMQYASIIFFNKSSPGRLPPEYPASQAHERLADMADISLYIFIISGIQCSRLPL